MKRFLFLCLSPLLVLATLPSCTPATESGVAFDISFMTPDDPAVTLEGNGNAKVSFTEKGGTVTVPISISTDWSAELKTAPWCTITPSGGKAGTVQMQVRAEENKVENRRETTITIRCGALLKYIHVSQEAAKPPYVELSTQDLTFDRQAGSQSFSVSSNATWTVGTSADWCKVSPSSGSGDGTVNVSVPDFNESGTRSATVTVKTPQGLAKTVNICQVGLDVFELSPSEISIGYEGGDVTVNVTTSIGYKITSMPEWITELTAGTETRSHQFRIDANPDRKSRSGVIVFCNDKEVCIPVTVNQEGKKTSLTLSESSLTFESEGGDRTLTLTANEAWSVTSADAWCTVSPSKGEGDASLTVHVPAFEEKTFRKTTLTFTAQELTRTVEVLQKGVDVFEIAPTEIQVGEDGGDFQISVVSTREYTVSTIPSWVRQTSASDDILTFHAEANNSTAVRTGVIVFTNDRNTNVSATVKQDGMTPKLEISPEEVFFDGDGGDLPVSVSSNLGWTAVSDQPWCKVSPESGTGNKDILIQTTANTVAAPRTATVTVTTTEGGLSRTIRVSQSGDEALTFDWTKEFYHRSLIFRFTATWCGYCPIMAHSLEVAHEKLPDRFVSVNVHGNSSALMFGSYSALDARFGVTGYPSSYMDYRREIGNYDSDYYYILVDRYLKEQETRYPAVTTAALKSTLTGNKLDVDVTLFFKQADKYKVTVYVTESGIIQYQADHTDGDRSDYRHDDVVRLSLTDVLGDDISVSSPHTRLKRSYSVTIPSGYRKDQLKVLVFVQRAFGSQERLQSGDYGEYYVDNCIYGKVGATLAPAIVSGNGADNEVVTDGKPVNW